MAISDKDITEAFGEGWKKDENMQEQDPKDEKAEVWDFKEKPIFKGIFIRTVKYDNKFGGESQMHFIEDEKNVRWKLFGNSMINDRLSTCVAGQEWGFVYHGKETSKKGNPYHNFEIFKKEVSQEVDPSEIPF